MTELVTLAMLLWSIGIMYLSFGMVRAGSVPFGMELGLPGTVSEQSALCSLCSECNLSGSGNVPYDHRADDTASGMCDFIGGHFAGSGHRDSILSYTVPPFSFSRIR